MTPKILALANSFVGTFSDGRDAIGRNVTGATLTRAMMEEVAWELGNEGEDFDRHFAKFAPLAKHLGADLRAEFDAGAVAA